ncbi:MAG: isoprenylcysteine carboxylmethyltransferase family protein [Verrucomicrobiae bacterium]|nr:isoprenylcysteine carboxylmethyltransferase family protein [Verrucomicrobiae bacterium]
MEQPNKNSGFWARGGAWVVAQNTLSLFIGVLSPLTKGGHTTGIWQPLGLFLIAIGAVYGIAGVVALGAKLSAFPTPKSNSSLVQHGIYKHVRHPLYASVGFLCAGWVTFWKSTPALILFLLLVVVLTLKARHEEKLLTTRFPEYESYRKQTKSVIPWLI